VQCKPSQLDGLGDLTTAHDESVELPHRVAIASGANDEREDLVQAFVPDLMRFGTSVRQVRAAQNTLRRSHPNVLPASSDAPATSKLAFSSALTPNVLGRLPLARVEGDSTLGKRTWSIAVCAGYQGSNRHSAFDDPIMRDTSANTCRGSRA
jgi:hypothetical protein